MWIALFLTCKQTFMFPYKLMIMYLHGYTTNQKWTPEHYLLHLFGNSYLSV